MLEQSRVEKESAIETVDSALIVRLVKPKTKKLLFPAFLLDVLQ